METMDERNTVELSKIAELTSIVSPREICTTVDAVKWLIDRLAQAEKALYELEKIRCERLAAKGLGMEATAVSKARVALSGKSQRSSFPRTPERDAEGNAFLYPGMPKYEGVAAIFGSKETGQVVILAPTVEDLDSRVREYGIADEITRGACKIASLVPLPNKGAES